jgi:acyl-CoA dehydrogenase
LRPYVLHHASEEQKQRWLPGIIDGTKILAIAMTEPGAGSDPGGHSGNSGRSGQPLSFERLQDIYLKRLSGRPCYHGCKDRPRQRAIKRNISADGGERKDGRFLSACKRLKKIGLHAQDTSELFYNDVKVPKENLLWEKGIRVSLPHVRACHGTPGPLCIRPARRPRQAIEQTVQYVKTRKAFGQEGW